MEQGHASGLHNCKTLQRRERGGCQHRAVSTHSPTHVVWLCVTAASWSRCACYCATLARLQSSSGSQKPSCSPSSTKTSSRRWACLSNSPPGTLSSPNISFACSEFVSPPWVALTSEWHFCLFTILSTVCRLDSPCFPFCLSFFFQRCWRFTGHCVDTTSSWRRAKRSPSNPFPVKSPISERNIRQRIQEIHQLVAALDHPGQPTQEQTWLWTNVTNHTMHICQ